jgi:hypothetical protein
MRKHNQLLRSPKKLFYCPDQWTIDLITDESEVDLPEENILLELDFICMPLN